MTPTEAECPVCKDRNGLVLYSITSKTAAQHYVLREQDEIRFFSLKAHIEKLWQGSSCKIVHCTACEFCFANPFVGGDARFYELAYTRSGYPDWKWEFEKTRRVLVQMDAQNNLGDGRLLEIGAGNGAFVKRIAPALFPKENVVCTEYSDYGAGVIRDYGIRCEPMDVRAFAPDEFGQSFDIICMFQVLEHLDELDQLFQKLVEISRNDAQLFIAVPNPKRIAFDELHGSLLDLPPNHTGRWSRRSFDVIARRHGWRVRDLAIEPERPLSRAAQYTRYRYLRKRQDNNTLANRVERVRRLPMRRALQAATVGIYAAASLRETFALMRTPMLGTSQWVHLQKNVSGM